MHPRAAGRRLHQRGQALRARPRKRLAGARCAECRRDHRRGAARPTRTATTSCAPSCTPSFPTSIKRELKRKPEETERGLGPRSTREAHPRGADALRAGHVGRRPAPPASDRRDARVHVRDLPQRGRPAAPSAGAQSADGRLEPARGRARQERHGSLLRARRSLHDACPHQGARAGDGQRHGRRPIEGGPLRQAAIADARAERSARQRSPAIRPPAAPTDDELRAKFQDTHDRGARADARRAAQGRGRRQSPVRR